jgi:hypothetical protein
MKTKIAFDSSALISNLYEIEVAGAGTLTYDATADQYIYIWKTLIVRLNDGTEHKAKFMFSK